MGWPKGKPQPHSRETVKKAIAGSVRAKHKRGIRDFELSAGANRGLGRGSQGAISASPAAFLSAHTYVDDFRYVNGDLDECEIRALEERLVYAHRCGVECCGPFDDLVIDVLAAVERTCSKQDDERRKKAEYQAKRRGVRYPPVAKGLLAPFKVKTPKRPVRVSAKPMSRKGTPLATVVAEMFPESREGRPLLEVVEDLFKPLT